MSRRTIERVVEVSLDDFTDEEILAEVNRRGIEAHCDCTAEHVLAARNEWFSEFVSDAIGLAERIRDEFKRGWTRDALDDLDRHIDDLRAEER